MSAKLKSFGEKLRQFRKTAGLTQQELAFMVAVSPILISNWERAYEHNGRVWRPARENIVSLVGVFADQLSLEEAQRWAALAGYRLKQVEVQKLVSSSASASSSSSLTSLPKPELNWHRQFTPPIQRLFGVERAFGNSVEGAHI